MIRFFALLMLIAAVAGSLGEYYGLLLPTLSWPFTVSREVAFLHAEWQGWQVYWFGWLCMLLLAGVGLPLLVRGSGRGTQLRWQRFRAIKRGYFSLLILLGLMFLAALDQCLVGHRALAVQYEGRWYFPAFVRGIYSGEDFGAKGDTAKAEADYHELSQRADCFVLMPPIPFSAQLYTRTNTSKELQSSNAGLLSPEEEGLYNGPAVRLNAAGEPHIRYRYRAGQRDGAAQGWDEKRQEVYFAKYEKGQLLSERYTGEGTVADFLAGSEDGEMYKLYYPPTPPLLGGHLLGTTSQGIDIAAYLFAGLQVNIKAVIFYLPIVYAIGLSVGMIMGFLGGVVDLFSQRVIEILAQLPFLFVVMVVVDFVPSQMRGMLLILLLLAAFGWMQMTYVIRTTTMREKNRDYVAASRLMGASNWHILRQHILPSLTPIIVTLMPFSVALVILSLASMDYLGFGLPDSYASWGQLLNDGLGKLNAPWIVSSAFVALVVTLLLINFVGEAVREAFDPKKHSFYR